MYLSGDRRERSSSRKVVIVVVVVVVTLTVLSKLRLDYFRCPTDI